MNAVSNQRLGMAYKPDDDLYNTKYEIEHTADQGHTPNFSIGLGERKVACRIGDVKMPRLVVQQKYAISIPFRRVRFEGILLEPFSSFWHGYCPGEFRSTVNLMSPSKRQSTIDAFRSLTTL